MPDKPLNDAEVTTMAAIMAGVWSAIKDKDNPAPTVDSAIALMGCDGLDRGDGRLVEFNTPEVRAALAGVLIHLADGDQVIDGYMLAHPEAHSIVGLAQAVNTTDIAAEISVFNLLKRGLVRKVTVGHSQEIKNGNIHVTVPVIMYQIEPDAWLKAMRIIGEEQDGD